MRVRYWRWKNGKKLEIRRLGDSYILNILGVMKRGGESVTNAFPPYRAILKEAKKRHLVSIRKSGFPKFGPY